MNIGIIVFIIMAQGFQHSAGFLCRRGIVEIDQWLPVNFLIKNRKVGPQAGPIELILHFLLLLFWSGGFGNHNNPSCSLAASVIMPWFQGGSHTNSTATSSTASSPSNLLCTSCASTGPMPQPGAVSVIFTSTRWFPGLV